MLSRSGVSGVRYSVTLGEVWNQDFYAVAVFIGWLKPMSTMPIQTVDVVLSVHKRCVSIEPENVVVVARHHLRMILSNFYLVGEEVSMTSALE